MNEPTQPSDSRAPGFYTPVGSRRTFFQWVIGAASALIGLGLAIPLVGYVISPALKRREQFWVEVGTVDELTVGQPEQLEYRQTVSDGWMTTTAHKAVWAVKQGADTVTIFSPICTHLGCGYRWDLPDRKFKCPCHGSVYDMTGRVVSGPAPRPLDELPVKIEGGKVLVMYKEFKSGLSKKVEI